MPPEEAVSWTVTVSKETDRSLRSFLSSQGILESERSRFIEQAVLARVFRRTVEEIHQQNRGISSEVIEAEVDAAVREVRQDRARERQRKLKQSS